MNLLRALSTVSGMTLLSRITGLARESLKAAAFGAGLQMDAFEAAFRLPNILRRLFAEGAFSQAFVPIFAEYRRQRGLDETTRARRARRHAAGDDAAPAVRSRRAGGAVARLRARERLCADARARSSSPRTMIRIVFPYILFVSLVSLAGGVLNVYRQFAIPAFTPVLLNLSIIGAALFLAPYCDPPIMALAWGVFIGGVAQLALQLRPLAKIGMLGAPALRLARRGRAPRAGGDGPGGARRVGRADLGAHQHAARVHARRWPHLVDHLRRPADGISERAPGRRARHRAAAVARQVACRRESRRSTRRCSTGACASRSCSRCPRRSRCGCSRSPLISTLYQYGRFTVNDVLQTRAALLGYSVGLLGLILVKILAPGFYARQIMATPVKIAFVTVLVTQTFARDPDVSAGPRRAHAVDVASARASTRRCSSGS